MSQNQQQAAAGQSQGAAQAVANGNKVINTRPAASRIGGVSLGTSAPAQSGPADPPSYFMTEQIGDVTYLVSKVPLVPTQRPDQENVTIGTSHGTKITSIPMEVEGVTVRALCSTNWTIKAAHVAAAKQGVSLKDYYKANPSARSQRG